MKYKARLITIFIFVSSLTLLPLSQIKAAADTASSVTSTGQADTGADPTTQTGNSGTATADSLGPVSQNATTPGTPADSVGPSVPATAAPSSASASVTPDSSTSTQTATPKTPKDPKTVSLASVSSTTSSTSGLPGVGPATKNTFPKVDAATGALTYDYPIVVPPGRNGMTPDVELKYNSQNADNTSFVGIGWRLSVPFIVRKNTHGTDQLYSRSDFTSSEDGDIVLSQTVGSVQTYVPLSQTPEYPTYTFNTSTNTWQLTTKTGAVLTFGDGTATRQDDPGNSAHIYKWMLSTSVDTNGNSITYSYTKNQGQIYPSSIAYTGHGASTGAYAVNFALAAVSTPAQVSYSTGFSVQTNSVISQITTNFNGVAVRTYTLNYSTDTRAVKPVLSSIGLSATNSSGTVNIPATNFTYADGSSGWSGQSTTWAMPTDSTFAANCGGTFQTNYADLNGDGLTDVIFACAGTNSEIFLNNGNGWNKSSTWTLPVDSTFAGNCGGSNYVTYYFTDLSGDGLPDYVLDCFGYSNDVFTNTGSGWSAKSTIWALPINSSVANNCGMYFQTSLADVNGDGLTDLIYGCIGQVSAIYLNSGSGWTLSSSWALPLDSSFAGQCGNISYIAYNFVDLNGDNLPDYVLTCKGFLSDVFLNTGIGWASTTSGTWALPSNSSLAANCSTYFLTNFADLNGDGLTDVIYGCLGQVNAVYINNGSGWALSSPWVLPTDNNFMNQCGTPASVSYAFLDLNGDNLPDYVLNCVGLLNEVYMDGGATYPKLTMLTLPTGGTISATYQTSPLYKDGNNNQTNPTLPFEIQTISSVTTTDTVNNISGTTTYGYAGGAYFVNSSNVFDRKFAGFQKVTATDPAGNVTITLYHTGIGTDSAHGEFADDEFKIGRIYRIEQYDNANHLFAKTINKWSDTSIATGASLVKLDQTVNSEYDGGASHKDSAIAYTYNTSTGNVTQKTEYGQVTGSDDGTFADTGTDQFTTAYAYASGGAVVGLPDDVTVTNQSAAKVKETKYFYDGSTTLGSVTKGNLTEQDDWKSGTSYITHKKSYDPTYGLVTQELDPNNNATNYAYDSFNLYPATVTNALTQSTAYTYDYTSGQIAQTTDVNGFVFKKTYDGLGRLILVQQPDLTTPTTLVTKTSYSYTDTQNAVSVAQSDYMDATNAVSTYTYFDGLGRMVQQRKSAEDSGNFNVKDFAYNNVGLLAKESLPYVSAGSAKTSATTTATLYINYAYDALGRITTASNAVGTTSNSYTPWQVTITDPNSHTKDLIKDAYENLIQVNEHNAVSTYITTYAYDYLKDLTNVTDANNNVRNFSFDGLGRRLSAQDLHPSSSATFGTWTYAYDNAGNLTQKIDSNGNTINYTYDVLNRPALEKLGTVTKVTYAYDTCTDGIGRLCSVTTPSLTTSDTYNALGFIATEIKNINSTNYETDYTYDRQGNQLTIVNPDGSRVIYTYNLAGMPETVSRKETTDGSAKAVVSNFDYSPLDDPSSISFANGAVTTNTYDSTKVYRLTHKVTTLSASNLQDISYTYDPAGNITAITDNSVTDTKKNITYGYDALNRLTAYSVASAVNGNNHSETYTYDPVGNITNKSDQGNYTYGGTGFPDPDAVTAIGSTTYTYDNNGNLKTAGSSLTNTWDYNNRLTQSVVGSTTITYSYDQNSERVKYSNGTTTTVYPTKNYNTNGTTATKHIFANGQPIADITGTGTGAVTQYVNTDQLTGSNVITNDSGATKEVLDYYPFGALRLDEQTSFNEQRKFAGHDYDTDTALSYMNARYYNPALGKFLSEDPAFVTIAFDPSDPQSLNPYSYSRDNPIRYIDPNGQWFEEALSWVNSHTGIGDAANTSPIFTYAVDHPAQGGLIAAGSSAAALVAPEVAAGISLRTAAVGLAGGIASQYVSDIANNIHNGQTGSAVLTNHSGFGQYAISGISVGATSVFAPQATPFTIGSIAAGTSFIQDRIGSQSITPGGLANNIVNGLGAAATEGLIRQASGIAGRSPVANTTADFIGAHAVASVAKQAVSAVSQFITSTVGSVASELFGKH